MSISKIVISKEGIAELRDSLNTISNHGMARLVARSEVKLTKKSRADKSPAPEWLAGLYRITATNVNVMHDYTAAVCNQIVAGGCDPAATI